MTQAQDHRFPVNLASLKGYEVALECMRTVPEDGNLICDVGDR